MGAYSRCRQWSGYSPFHPHPNSPPQGGGRITGPWGVTQGLLKILSPSGGGSGWGRTPVAGNGVDTHHFTPTPTLPLRGRENYRTLGRYAGSFKNPLSLHGRIRVGTYSRCREWSGYLPFHPHPSPPPEGEGEIQAQPSPSEGGRTTRPWGVTQGLLIVGQ